MKKALLLAIVLLICQTGMSQEAAKKAAISDSKESCITIGILQGGGSLIGADFEFMYTKKLSIQL